MPLSGEAAEHWRRYRLVKLTGWTRDQIDSASAVECDWLLEIDRVVGEVEAARMAPT